MDRLATLTDRIGQFCESHADGRIDGLAFLEHCTRLVACDIGCARTGIWQFVELAGGTRALRGLAMYDATIDRSDDAAYSATAWKSTWCSAPKSMWCHHLQSDIAPVTCLPAPPIRWLD